MDRTTDSPFLHSHEVAARLNLSVSTVRRITRAGQLPHRRLNGRQAILYPTADLLLWEDGCSLETVELAGESSSHSTSTQRVSR